MADTEFKHLRVLIANERRDRLDVRPELGSRARSLAGDSHGLHRAVRQAGLLLNDKNLLTNDKRRVQSVAFYDHAEGGS